MRRIETSPKVESLRRDSNSSATTNEFEEDHEVSYDFDPIFAFSDATMLGR